MTTNDTPFDAPAPRPSRVERLAICTPTYLRPIGLERLLDALDKLDPVAGLEPTMVVIDNDPEASAAWVAGRSVFGRPLQYHHEPNRGITFARNRALVEAKALDADWIAWLDDDEAPRQDWLASLVATQRDTGADVVMGPAEPVFDPEASDWIAETGSFGTERFASGQPFPYFHARTSGLIFRASLAPEAGFDDRLSLTGGEDRLFFTRMHRAGASFVWDDEAVVDEWVPTSRVSMRWLSRRWFRIGVTRSLTMLYLDDPSRTRRARRVAGGGLMAAQGMFDVARAVPQKSEMLRSTRRVLLGVGASWGALGFTFREYRKVQGE